MKLVMTTSIHIVDHKVDCVSELYIDKKCTV